MPAVWIGTVLETRTTNRKIEIDLVPALGSSYSWGKGRQLTVTQCSDSLASVPARETRSADEEAKQLAWVESEKTQKPIKSFQGRESSFAQTYGREYVHGSSGQ